MKKVVGMLVALVLFGALPAVAAAQGTSPSSGGNTVSSGNTQTGTVNQGANAGGETGDNDGTRNGNGTGGNAGNQACLIQQNAGRDANAACNQSQNFGGGAAVRTGVGRGVVGVRTGVSGVSRVGTVQGVTLARTGFDAWVLALIGGAAVAGGLGLLAAGRRGRLSA
jgi:hypothetical protein